MNEILGKKVSLLCRLKALLVITQIITVSIQTVLGINEQWRAVDGIQHCEKRLALKQRSFCERGNFSLKCFELHSRRPIESKCSRICLKGFGG